MLHHFSPAVWQEPDTSDGNKRDSLASPQTTMDSESIAGPNILKLLGHFRWGSVQLFRDIFLLVGLHGVELLTKVSINHILNREIIRTKAEVVPSTERRMLRPQVHLNMLEKVVVLTEETDSISKKEVIYRTKYIQEPGSYYRPQSGLQLEILLTVVHLVWDYS